MQIKKVLIANRGEIALRVIRTCKEMGIKSVALCPERGLEEDFLETQLADEFCYLDKDGLTGYLDQAKIISLAKQTEADAIHPGYGFLAENADFARLCALNGIKFIGPAPDTIRMLGDKIEAKKIARKCGLPILPGTVDAVKDEKECIEMVKKIGLPCLLKAVDGGGGIGIEIIDKDNFKDIKDIFARLQRLAQNAFGSGRIFIEKFLVGPRHIEFQILGDGKGNVIHLNERECSIQRRHQKLLEEAPSPFLDNFLRSRMGAAAVKIAKYLKYEGVGTVEFLVDKNKNFYFGEVNPRLQVEHPITEIITGVDLVEQQIRVASGEKLALTQWDIKILGHAMELRICAEDPCQNFQPQSGMLTKYLLPGGRGVEVHSFCQPGQKIFPFFDSMIAKLVVRDQDRSRTIKKALRALGEYKIEGVETNLPFHKVLLENENFCKGKLSTDFIEKEGIIQEVKKSCRVKEEPKAQEKEVISVDDLANILADLYYEVSKARSIARANKWKLGSRMKMME